MGSVGHLRGECIGLEDVSEDGMTRRQAAKAAWAYFQTRQEQACGPSDRSPIASDQGLPGGHPSGDESTVGPQTDR